jgi:Tol biopolymer transport system component
VLVVALSDPRANDGDPSFSADLLELIFTSNRNGTLDLWTSHRASAAEPWGTPVPVPELNSPFSDYGPAISLDGLRIWFTTDRDAQRGRLWQSSRGARQDAWDPPLPVVELASPSVDFSPSVDATETTMVFGSNRPGSAGFDVYLTRRATASARWGIPRLVPGLNSTFDDWDPFVAQAGLVVFFTSMRSGAGDILWSARQSTAEPFPPPIPLTDINSSAYDSDSSLSLDLSYLMFDSTRSGNSEIYESHALD